MEPPTLKTASLPAIYTLTGNLLWEHTLEFETWSSGRTQRAHSDTFQVGGKGVNVSRMLMRLEAPTMALVFAGGATGTDCLAWLRARKLPHTSFETKKATRIGLVIRGGTQPETTFLGPDVAPEAAACAACAAHLDSLPDGQTLALCGSFPGWADAAAQPLRTALQRWAHRGMLVADTYGPTLHWALQQPLALVKINRDEFNALSPAAPAADLSGTLPAALSTTGAAAWIVTDGEAPVWIAERGATAALSVQPPRVATVSPTGSGDVLLACLLHARQHRRLSWHEALVWALPYAAANAAHPGVAEFDLNKVSA
jgi:fructose-1-phosphate kinase PfkB-like protein